MSNAIEAVARESHRPRTPFNVVATLDGPWSVVAFRPSYSWWASVAVDSLV